MRRRMMGQGRDLAVAGNTDRTADSTSGGTGLPSQHGAHDALLADRDTRRHWRMEPSHRVCGSEVVPKTWGSHPRHCLHFTSRDLSLERSASNEAKDLIDGKPAEKLPAVGHGSRYVRGEDAIGQCV